MSFSGTVPVPASDAHGVAEVEHLFSWTLPILTDPASDVSTTLRALTAVATFIESESAVSPLEPFIASAVQACQGLLEDEATSAVLLPPLLSILRSASHRFPRFFNPHFEEIVDLLLGWAMEPSISATDRRLLTRCLSNFNPQWLRTRDFTHNVLSKLLGDIESEAKRCLGLRAGHSQSGASVQLGRDSTSAHAISKERLLSLTLCFSAVLEGFVPVHGHVSTDPPAATSQRVPLVDFSQRWLQLLQQQLLPKDTNKQAVSRRGSGPISGGVEELNDDWLATVQPGDAWEWESTWWSAFAFLLQATADCGAADVAFLQALHNQAVPLLNITAAFPRRCPPASLSHILQCHLAILNCFAKLPASPGVEGSQALIDAPAYLSLRLPPSPSPRALSLLLCYGPLSPLPSLRLHPHPAVAAAACANLLSLACLSPPPPSSSSPDTSKAIRQRMATPSTLTPLRFLSTEIGTCLHRLGVTTSPTWLLAGLMSGPGERQRQRHYARHVRRRRHSRGGQRRVRRVAGRRVMQLRAKRERVRGSARRCGDGRREEAPGRLSGADAGLVGREREGAWRGMSEVEAKALLSFDLLAVAAAVKRHAEVWVAAHGSCRGEMKGEAATSTGVEAAKIRGMISSSGSSRSSNAADAGGRETPAQTVAQAGETCGDVTQTRAAELCLVDGCGHALQPVAEWVEEVEEGFRQLVSSLWPFPDCQLAALRGLRVLSLASEELCDAGREAEWVADGGRNAEEKGVESVLQAGADSCESGGFPVRQSGAAAGAPCVWDHSWRDIAEALAPTDTASLAMKAEGLSWVVEILVRERRRRANNHSSGSYRADELKLLPRWLPPVLFSRILFFLTHSYPALRATSARTLLALAAAGHLSASQAAAAADVAAVQAGGDPSGEVMAAMQQLLVGTASAVGAVITRDNDDSHGVDDDGADGDWNGDVVTACAEGWQQGGAAGHMACAGDKAGAGRIREGRVDDARRDGVGVAVKHWAPPVNHVSLRPPMLGLLINFLARRKQTLPPDWLPRLFLTLSLSASDSSASTKLPSRDASDPGVRGGAGGDGGGGGGARAAGQSSAQQHGSKLMEKNRAQRELDQACEAALLNDSLSAHWAAQLAARQCVAARLRTPIGGASATFASFERMLHDAVRAVSRPVSFPPLHTAQASTAPDSGSNPSAPNTTSAAYQPSPDTLPSLTPTPASLCVGAQLALDQSEPRDHLLAVHALPTFLEALERQVWAAAAGTVLFSPPAGAGGVTVAATQAGNGGGTANGAAAAATSGASGTGVGLGFFQANRRVCEEWFGRLRVATLHLSMATGSPEGVVCHGCARLREMKLMEGSYFPTPRPGVGESGMGRERAGASVSNAVSTADADGAPSTPPAAETLGPAHAHLKQQQQQQRLLLQRSAEVIHVVSHMAEALLSLRDADSLHGLHAWLTSHIPEHVNAADEGEGRHSEAAAATGSSAGSSACSGTEPLGGAASQASSGSGSGSGSEEKGSGVPSVAAALAGASSSDQLSPWLVMRLQARVLAGMAREAEGRIEEASQEYLGGLHVYLSSTGTGGALAAVAAAAAATSGDGSVPAAACSGDGNSSTGHISGSGRTHSSSAGSTSAISSPASSLAAVLFCRAVDVLSVAGEGEALRQLMSLVREARG